MKKVIFSTIGILGLTFFTSSVVFAQGMIGNVAISLDGHTAREEAEGKVFLEKLQAKQVQCADLSDDDFGVLGEYFMGQMTGTSHEAMNTMMEQMMGKDGEEQMHVVMGKRLSGCDTSVAFPSQGVGFMPMMQMMMGGWPARNASQSAAGGSSPFASNQTNNPMMWGNNNPMGLLGLGGFGWIFMILFWVLIIVGIIAIAKWFANQSRGVQGEKSPFEILKERYAKGEIDKKEFEEKKKDLS